MVGIWRWYSRIVDKYPWGSQILQTGVLCAAGDVIAQASNKIKTHFQRCSCLIWTFCRWQWRRKAGKSLNFPELGGFSSWAPVLCVLVSGNISWEKLSAANILLRSWYLVLEKLVKHQGTRGALTKMVLDQSLFAPSFLCVFVTAASTLQGLSLAVSLEIKTQILHFSISGCEEKSWSDLRWYRGHQLENLACHSACKLLFRAIQAQDSGIKTAILPSAGQIMKGWWSIFSGGEHRGSILEHLPCIQDKCFTHWGTMRAWREAAGNAFYTLLLLCWE